jgi:hypothetical protein
MFCFFSFFFVVNNLNNWIGCNQKMAFLGPWIKHRPGTLSFIQPIVRHHGRSLTHRPFSPHPGYDVAAVSTYVAYLLTQYWDGEQRRDVELFAMVMGFFWSLTHDHDATIFLFLWVIGASSEFISKSFLAGGNTVEYEKFRVGIKLGGYMSFLLFVFDLLDVLTGN